MARPLPLPLPPAAAGVEVAALTRRALKGSAPPNSTSFVALHHRGIRQYQVGAFAEAAASLSAALRIAPTHAGLWTDLGAVHAAWGRLDDAMNCYDRALASRPSHVDAWNNKGNLWVALGRHREALSCYDRALEFNPGSAAAHNNRGGALRDLGRLPEALTSFDRALAINRRHFDALKNRGATLVDLGRPAEALESYDRALAINPACADAVGNRGNALLKLGRYDEALKCYDRALALNPHSAQAHTNRGGALRLLERYDDAIAACERALALTPDNADALTNLANVLMSLKRPADALAVYDTALRARPNFATALSNRAQSLIELARPARALASVEKALALDPGDPDAHNVRGGALLELDRHAEALDSYDKAISLDPRSALPHNNKGIALIQLGRIEEGIAALETAIGLEPLCGRPYYHLAQAKRWAANDPVLAAMEELIQGKSPLRSEDRIHLRFAAAKAFADLGDFERSFQHLSVGNAAERARFHYDEAGALDHLARARAAYAREMIAGDRGGRNSSEVPVFIVGMPRSGSTLVEQILASHPDVHGAGEIGDFHAVMAELGGPVAEAFASPEAISRVSNDQLTALGTAYLESIGSAAPTASRIVNKMLGNFRFVGLIALALPRARFIHVQRDPVDACMSCFSTLFTESIPYAYDLGELGRYYRAYEAMMSAWRELLPPERMLHIHYERVVADLDGEARRVVEHCGLEWRQSCLDFHRNTRAVRTASVVQVRQPIYRSSVGRSRPYARFLGPLLAQFEPTASEPAPSPGRFEGNRQGAQS